MRTSVNAILALVVMLVGLCLAPWARAQNGNGVAVRLDVPQKMYVGDTGDLQIVVTGSRNVEAPDLSNLKDFEVVYRAPQDASSTMTTIMNGRVQTTERDGGMASRFAPWHNPRSC